MNESKFLIGTLKFLKIILICILIVAPFLLHATIFGKERTIESLTYGFTAGGTIGLYIIGGFLLCAAIYVIVNSGKSVDVTESIPFKLKKLVDLNEQEKVTLQDLIITDELKERLQNVCNNTSEQKKEMLKKEMLKKAGCKPSGGYIFHGPPGTGKTTLASAIAGETNSNFIEISATQLVSKYVGGVAENIRKLFETARKNSPCIIFIDEIDAIGRERSGGSGHSQSNDESVVELLSQLNDDKDGQKNKGVVVIVATNHLDVLDSALIRSGRFDEKILIDLPDEKSREKIFDLHMKKGSVSSKLNLQKIAKKTDGFSGADLEYLAKKVKVYAVNRMFKEQIEKIATAEITVTMDDFDNVFPKFKSEIQNPKNEEVSNRGRERSMLQPFLTNFARELC